MAPPRIILVIIYLLGPAICFSQGDSLSKPTADHFQQSDIRDLLKKSRDKGQKGKANFLLVVPVIVSNPTSGLVGGAAMSYTFKTFPADNRLSNLSANASYSTKGMININTKSNIFVTHEKWILNGDWRYLLIPETTYGPGTKVPGSAAQNSAGLAGQSLKYKLIRFHEIASRKFTPVFFAGLGFQYDHYAAIKDQVVADKDTAASYQYQYSVRKGFSPQQYTTSGICVNLIYDSRDNEFNTYKGYYANLNYLVNSTAIGSSQNSTMLLAEYRAFYPLDRKQRNILTFWLYGNFVTSGAVPYLALPAIGYDERQRSGRGYTFGYFRGEQLMYAESEYRFPISPHTGILGGVLFLNLTTTSDKGNKVELGDYVRAGYGAGLRIMLDKASRTRFQIDAAMAHRRGSFYIGIQETF